MKPCEKVRKGCSIMKEEDRHLCPKLCYEDCIECDVKVRKKRTICSHFYEIACKENVDNLVCKKNCTKLLPCGHKCPRKCFEECGGCKVQVC